MALPDGTAPLLGQCHCGAVQVRVTLAGGFARARRCDCSYCARRGAIVVSAQMEDVTILQGGENLSLYQWGTRAAKHWFCKTCGIYTHHQRRSNPQQFGVNVAILAGVNPRDLGDVPWVDGVNHPADRPVTRRE